jgi:hypothetical protein
MRRYRADGTVKKGDKSRGTSHPTPHQTVVSSSPAFEIHSVRTSGGPRTTAARLPDHYRTTAPRWCEGCTLLRPNDFTGSIFGQILHACFGQLARGRPGDLVWKTSLLMWSRNLFTQPVVDDTRSASHRSNEQTRGESSPSHYSPAGTLSRRRSTPFWQDTPGQANS